VEIGGFTGEQKGNIEQKTNEILFRTSLQGSDPKGPTGWRRLVKKSVEILGENLGETGVLKDALGLGLLLLLIASTQMASFVFGA
jgi:hypothetical protein